MNLKNSTQTFIVGILIIAAGFGGYFAGKNEVKVAWDRYKPSVTVQNLEPAKPIENANFDFKLFWDVFDRVQKQYIGRSSLDAQKMYYGAIQGMVASLGDPYTVFLPPTQNKEVREELAGHFEGIGAQLEVKDKKIVVAAPIKDSPAEKAGIKAGDWIVAVDGKETPNLSLPETVAMIRGEKGTKVKLTVVHEGAASTSDIEITRDTIVVKSVELTQKDSESSAPKTVDSGAVKEEQDNIVIERSGKKVAVIKLSRFGEGTNNEFQDIVTHILEVKKKNPDTFKGVVLDLRNNPGGFLTGAVYIGSEFLADGTVVMQENAKGERQSFPVNRVGRLTKEPLVILMNKGSASASEIVSGAMQDRGRAKLVGEKSFGKGTIQEAQELGEGAGLHLTVAKWLTPNGRWVNDLKGLTPDIEVKLDEANPSNDTQLERALQELIKN